FLKKFLRRVLKRGPPLPTTAFPFLALRASSTARTKSLSLAAMSSTALSVSLFSMSVLPPGSLLGTGSSADFSGSGSAGASAAGGGAASVALGTGAAACGFSSASLITIGGLTGSFGLYTPGSLGADLVF